VSHHIFETNSQGRRVSVVLGYDRILDRFFLVVQRLDSPTCKGRRRSGRDSGPDFLYANTADPNAQDDLGYYREKLEARGISLPRKVFREVFRDFEDQVGNRVVRHYANGKRVVLAR
jgi:hypothetical protein